MKTTLNSIQINRIKPNKKHLDYIVLQLDNNINELKADIWRQFRGTDGYVKYNDAGFHTERYIFDRGYDAAITLYSHNVVGIRALKNNTTNKYITFESNGNQETIDFKTLYLMGKTLGEKDPFNDLVIDIFDNTRIEVDSSLADDHIDFIFRPKKHAS